MTTPDAPDDEDADHRRRRFGPSNQTLLTYGKRLGTIGVVVLVAGVVIVSNGWFTRFGGKAVRYRVGGTLLFTGVAAALVGLRLAVIGLRRRRQDAADLATITEWDPSTDPDPPPGPIS